MYPSHCRRLPVAARLRSRVRADWSTSAAIVSTRRSCTCGAAVAHKQEGIALDPQCAAARHAGQRSQQPRCRLPGERRHALRAACEPAPGSPIAGQWRCSGGARGGPGLRNRAVRLACRRQSHIAAAPPLGLDTTDPSGRAAAAWPAGRRGLCRWRQIEHTPVNAASWLLHGELEEDRPAWKELGQSAHAPAAALGPLSGRHPARTTRLGAAPTPR